MAKALKNLAKEFPSLSEAFEPPEIHHDRALAITTAAWLEDVLERCLVASMVTLTKAETNGLFDFDSPVGSFSARIRLAYALGFFGPITRNDLDHLRHIRNAFAHARKTITFETKEIAAECRKLKLCDMYTVSPTYDPKRAVDRYTKTAFVIVTGIHSHQKPRPVPTVLP